MVYIGLKQAQLLCPMEYSMENTEQEYVPMSKEWKGIEKFLMFSQKNDAI